MKRTLLAMTGAGAVALSAILLMRPGDAPPSPTARPLPPPPTGQPGAGTGGDTDDENVADFPRGSVDTPLSDEQIARVEAHLQLENTRQSIQDYFDDPSAQASRAPEILDAINRLEREGRVIGFEAMHLKLSWLALNTSDESAYEEQAAALIEGYAQRDRAAQQEFRPDSIPGFTDYKTREAQIIAEVNAMDSFPQGQTRQQYLRERLLEARIEAYGEAGEP